MTCREVIDFLMEYLTLELPAPQAEEFERHLSACPSCVAYLQSYEQTIQLGRDVAAAEPEEVPEDLVAAILKARGQP